MIEKIKSFSNLTKGWDSYKAEPPNSEAIEIAICFYQLLELNLVEPRRVAPSVVGGIGMSWKDIYVEIYNNGEIVSVFGTNTLPVEDMEIKTETSIEILVEKINTYVTN